MKSQMDILLAVIRERATAIGYNSERDVATVSRRVGSEGNGFLEVALPTLDDLLLEGLSSGRLPEFTGWSRRKGSTLPAFLWGFWRRVFTHDGELLSCPCIESIRSIRQISRTFKKVFEVCAEDRVLSSIKGFEETDLELSQLRIPSDIDAAREIAHYAFGGVVGATMTGDVRFQHGPGAVAERLDSVQKYEFSNAPDRLTAVVGHDQFHATWYDMQQNPLGNEETPARLIAVPKTATKPRLISIEPSYNQFIQQGYHTLLKKELDRIRICGYSSQVPNQKLALEGSRDGSLVTVDLSEASDRVHYGVVRSLFSFNPSFIEMLDATRSRMVTLPDGRVHILNKFASMGSALTFPIETMVFSTLVLLAVCTVERRFDAGFVKSLLSRRDIRVYGDDIIVPSKYYPNLLDTLGRYGLKVNTSKSFSQGLFRESCGFDAYAGVNITPVYARRRLPSSKRHVAELISLVSFRNQWVSTYGYGEVQRTIDSYVESIIPMDAVRTGSPHNGGIHYHGPMDQPRNSRWNDSLQRLEVRVMVPSEKRRPTRATDRGVLFKTLYEGLNEDPDHFTHDARPISASLKYRWRAA